MSRRQSGFTLMEVLIALAILGIGMLAVISTVGHSTSTALELKQRTFAHWVAMNEATRLRTSLQWPDVGEQNGTVQLARETWRWTADISKTVAPNLRRADISVALDSKPDAPVSTLIVFIGKPMPAGSSALPPGAPNAQPTGGK
ncbi:MAG TPA: type II secretion system minor pseudopilin GspI [Gammaproteobacteria bacterium]|nr:type II secretion system minor pseudopilin GspI [Gammaproteobacteria bacterium]